MADPPLPPQARRGRWVAIITGGLSILIGLLYLALIVLLDSRGPLQPPPPEALGQITVGADGAAVAASAPAGAPPPA